MREWLKTYWTLFAMTSMVFAGIFITVMTHDSIVTWQSQARYFLDDPVTPLSSNPYFFLLSFTGD